MNCDDCLRMDSVLLEALVAADKAETALRCYFLTHHRTAGVSDLAEYNALRARQQQASDDRHNAYLASIEHRKQHSS